MRNKLIKATAWINVGILVLSIYVAKNIPENSIFAICSATASCAWLMAFYMKNIVGGTK